MKLKVELNEEDILHIIDSHFRTEYEDVVSSSINVSSNKCDHGGYETFITSYVAEVKTK